MSRSSPTIAARAFRACSSACRAHPARRPHQGRTPSAGLKALRSIMAGPRHASRMYETFRPSAVIGFWRLSRIFPALLAARRGGIPTLVHEQNAVLGR
jgi:UDP-N-acetylglucosamine--N-acetylmuramyl-(pentapeptide) pyrophosphoryl-undecaprenol N-acetylglucosamine transferase